MKITIFKFVFLINLAIIISICDGTESESESPDITMYFNAISNRVTCVAGTNTLDNALALITPLSNKIRYSEFKYKNVEEDGSEMTLSDCDFEYANSDCTREWINNGFQLIKSGEYHLSPVINDERWNKFSVYQTSGGIPEYEKVYVIEKRNFHVDFSVRSKENAQIMLCETGINDACYWILIDAFEFNLVTAIRKCIHGVPDDYPRDDYACKKRRHETKYKEQVLSESNWSHFRLTRVNDNKIVLIHYSRLITNILLEWIDDDDERPLNITKMYFKSYNTHAEWKIHEYHYCMLQSTTTMIKNKRIKLAELLQPNNNKRTTRSVFCLSLYVALCSTCHLEIVLEDEFGIVISTETIQGSYETNWTWQHVQMKVQFEYHFDLHYNLFLLVNNYNTDEMSFWAFDDIRCCHNGNEIRQTSIDVNWVFRESISCNSLQFVDWTFTNNKQTNQQNAMLRCDNINYTGTYCNITCATLFGNGQSYCQQNKMCRPTNRNVDSRKSCTCLAGSTGPNCNTECPSGFYGNNCEGNCGRCKHGMDYCHPVNGTCFYNCDDGYYPPLCKIPILPYLVVPPNVISVSHTSITLQLDNITLVGTVNANQFYISYKRLNEHWQLSRNVYDLKVGNKMELDGLKSETLYTIRIILYAEDEQLFTDEAQIPTIQVNTTCRVNRKMNLKPYSKSVIIIIKEDDSDKDSCIINNYYVIITENDVEISRNQFQTNQMQLFNLQPFKTYRVLLKHTKYLDYIDSIDFTTLEDAPSKVRNVQLKSASDTTLIVTWDIPQFPNGVIRNYIVQYTHFKYIDCMRETTYYYYYENILEAKDTISEIELTHLLPYSIYKIEIIAVTLTNGSISSTLFTTNMTEMLENKELPTNLEVEANAEQARVTWTLSDCNKRKGPLFYTVVVKCINDSWCNNNNIKQQQINNNNNNNIMVYDLIPFTYYSVELKTTRFQTPTTNQHLNSKNFWTKEAAPGPIRNLTVYSRDSNILQLRWQNPYPPNGIPEMYELRYCRWICKSIQIHAELNVCQLWNQYICFDLVDVKKNSNYEIQITTKNRNVAAFGQQALVTAQTKQGSKLPRLLESSPPLNLIDNWNGNVLTLIWNHPFTTNGTLVYFQILFKQIDTELLLIQHKTYMEKLFIKHHPLGQYQFIISNGMIPFSSTYFVSVCGVNDEHVGLAATLQLHTPPEMPQLSKSNVTVLEENITNSTISISIPSIKTETKSRISFMYIVISESDDGIISKNKKEKEDEIFKLISSTDQPNSWIAIEIKPNDISNELIIMIGNDTVEYSNHLNTELWNKPLKPLHSYNVTVVLMNSYMNKQRYQLYRLYGIQTAAQFNDDDSLYGLFALLLLLPLLLLLVVGWFIYKEKLKKNNIDETEQQDVIPLNQKMNDLQNESKPTNNQIVPPPPPPPPPQTINDYYSHLVKITHLENYIREALMNGELEKQHALFPRGQTKPWHYGLLKENKFKNRYNNLIAYDDTRVKLEKINNDPYSDYINANYINGYKQRKAYIATQGPKPTTVHDFWRMIWQQRVQYIVMLANVVEGGKKKCEQYWPNIDECQQYHHEQIEVSHVKSEIYADYQYRTFEIRKFNEQRRQVVQLHFTSWPDHGVPLYPQSLVCFLKKMLTIPQMANGPIVVHCSAGVGRTGTIILCDICLRMAAAEGAVDILHYLHKLREQRANMVDNIDQYKLVHMVLLECLLSPDTNIACNNKFASLVEELMNANNGLEMQMNYLTLSSWQDDALNFTPEAAAVLEPNESKNRFKDIVPLRNRIYISRYPTTNENSDYINAIPVDGFNFKSQFIVTQLPMPNTVCDFWRMVAEQKIRIIVSLNEIPNNDKTCCIFWPQSTDKDDIKATNELVIKYNKSLNCDHWNIHNFSLVTQDDKKSTVELIQFKNWSHSEQCPNNIEQLVALWEQAEILCKATYPIIVTCYDGVTASGLFVAMSFLIEKIKLEQQCDVCLAVRVIRRNRKQFIKDKNQLEFLYKSAIAYLAMFETYSNFQS